MAPLIANEHATERTYEVTAEIVDAEPFHDDKLCFADNDNGGYSPRAVVIDLVHIVYAWGRRWGNIDGNHWQVYITYSGTTVPPEGESNGIRVNDMAPSLQAGFLDLPWVVELVERHMPEHRPGRALGVIPDTAHERPHP